MQKKRGVAWLFFIVFCGITSARGPWTRTFYFFNDACEKNDTELIFAKRAEHAFTQLLISWHAHNQTQGYFRFYVEVFDEKTKIWSTYKTYEWGYRRQASFLHKDSHSSAAYVHVRFEGASDRKYYTFRIKIEAVDGASIHDVDYIVVCASDMKRFKPEAYESAVKNIESSYIKNVPRRSQYHENYPESNGWCSPASVAQLIEFYNKVSIDLPTFAHTVYDRGLNVYGSWPFNTAQAALHLPNHLCYVTRLKSIQDLSRLLVNGHPVILSICCSMPLTGAPKAYDQGHLITVIGIEKEKRRIICHDTAEKDVTDMVKYYPMSEFMRAWENRQRLAYVIVPRRQL